MRPKFLILLTGCLLFFVCSTGTIRDNKEKTESYSIDELKNMKITHVDPAAVPDGAYTGEILFRYRHVYKVSVKVKSGVIEDVEVLNNGTENDYAKKGLGVIPRIIEKQSPDVDAISGATVTSKALMKCVEKALKGSLVQKDKI